MIIFNVIALQYRTGSKPEMGAVVIGALILGIVLYFISRSKPKKASEETIKEEAPKNVSRPVIPAPKTTLVKEKKVNPIPLIINKIKDTESITISQLETHVGELTFAGKYQAFLITAAIIVNRLKTLNAFSVYKIDGDQLFMEILNLAEEKHKQYKGLYLNTTPVVKHRSAIIEGNINRENRNTFKLNVDELKYKSVQMISIYDLEIGDAFTFNISYTNLYIYSFFDTNIPTDEQNRVRNSYLELAARYDAVEYQNIKPIMVKIINIITERLNADKVFIQAIQSF